MQISKPVNLNGYIIVQGSFFFTYAMPIHFLKSRNLNWNGAAMQGTSGLLNNVENISKTYNYNAGWRYLIGNIGEYIDFLHYLIQQILATVKKFNQAFVK